MLIKIDSFAGAIPKLGERLLGDTQAVTALNCKLFSGELRPWKAPLQGYNSGGSTVSLFMYRDQVFFIWATDVNVVRSPIKGDSQSTIYFTGSGSPKFTDVSITTTADGGPSQSYALGVPTPQSAAVAAIAGGSPSVNSATAVTTQYVYTWVFIINGKTMEGPPSPVSNSVDYDSSKLAAGTHYVGLTFSETVPYDANDPFAAYPVSGAMRRIYRVDAGLTGSEFLLVAEQPIATTTYSDSKKSTLLGTSLRSTNYTKPPTTLKGLIAMANGNVAGFLDNKILFCEPFLPHAWPSDYYQATDYPIVGLGSFGTSLVVCTTGNTYLISGTSPKGMSMIKLGIEQACVSKRSIVTAGDSVIYASPDGLVQVSGRSATLITEPFYTKDEWQALVPSGIIGAYHDNRYFGFYAAGTFIFDFDNPQTGITFSDIQATAAHTNQATDSLYYQSGNYVMKWNSSGSYATYTWKSKIWVNIKPVNLSWCQVEAASYPVTLKVYAGGNLKHTQTVADGNPFRLPSGFLEKEWQIEISGTANVRYVHLATSVGELGAS